MLFLLDPSEVGQVLVTGSTSTSISLSWQPPSQTNGIILRYTVTGTPVSTVGLVTPSTTTETQDLLINVCFHSLTLVPIHMSPSKGA